MRFRHLLTALTLSSATALGQAIDSCGTVEAGVTCQKLFRADSTGGLYILDAPLTTHAVGDRIRVSGAIDPTCISICQQGDGCILGTAIQSCVQPIGTSYCQGVANSTGQIGRFAAFGSEATSANDVTLVATELPPGSAALFLCSATQRFVTQPSGAMGNLCLGGTIGRFVPQVQNADALGMATIGTDPALGARSFSLSALPQPTGTVSVMPGSTWNFQAWYRDAVGGVATSNFTVGHSIQFV